MSEVKTYKCDVCGKVYHVDENYGTCMTIFDESIDEDSRHITGYEHICPDCTEVINKVIGNPGIIDDLKEKANIRYRNASAMEQRIRDLRNRLCGWKMWLPSIDYIDTDVVQDVDLFIEEIDGYCSNLKESKRLWKTAAVIFGTWGLIAFILL